MFCRKCKTWFHLEPSQHQCCHKCKEWFHLSDGGFLETLDAQGKLVFVCEGCELNMAPRDDEWTRDLGGGRILVMELVFGGYRATLMGFRGVGATQSDALDDLMGFRGVGTTQSDALDDLLVRMRDYGLASDDFERSLTPGGHLSEQLRQIEQLVDQIAQGQSQS